MQSGGNQHDVMLFTNLTYKFTLQSTAPSSARFGEIALFHAFALAL